MTSQTCPDCGGPIPADAPGGLCPACLLRLAEPAVAPQVEVSEAAPVAAAGLTASDSKQPATRIGRYKLLEIIGEGGFGTVWMAEQQEPVRRQVALKIIKLGMDTRQVVARFEAERQALALMEHPNIARVLDAGATDAGRPFFVMELVRGLPITEFCDTRQLTTRERIELFIPVCQAVQHAHQKGVIHRDLKPSNILVTGLDGRAIPKIIDFGVAKAIAEPLTDKTLFTRFHQFLGTPAYMSPEQAGLGGLDIDTRTDIYALGVLLYELLTGQPPLNARELRGAGQEAMLQTIREVEPPKPSARLSTLKKADLTTIATRRREEPQRLSRLIRGDLDWIVLKALEKDRARRYETANGLAADLRRYLDNEPIVARPPGTLYRFGKLARRHKLAFAAVGAVLAALIAGLITTSWQASRAKRHLEQARLNAYVSEVNVAHLALAENNLARALQLLDRHRPKGNQTDLRGFEWRYLWQLCRSDSVTDFHDEGADAIEYSPDGRWFAYGGGRKVIIRDAASYQVITNLPTSARSLSCSSDGRLLVWDLAEGVPRLLGEHREHSTHVTRIAVSPAGNVIATVGEDQTLNLWERTTYRHLARVRAHTNSIYGLAISPDGQTVLTGSVSDGVTRVWRTDRSDASDQPTVGSLIAGFTADSRALVLGPRNADCRWQLVGPSPTTVAVATNLALPGDLMNRPFDVFGDKPIGALGRSGGLLELWDLAAGTLVTSWQAATNQICAVTFSPDGRQVATGSETGDIKIWDVATRTELATIRPAATRVTSLAFSRDGKRLVGAVGWFSSTVFLWDVVNRRPLPFPRDRGGIIWLEFSPDGRLIAAAGMNGDVELWDSFSGAPVAQLKGHVMGVLRACFFPDGKTLATGGMDGRVKLWNLATFQELLTLPVPSGTALRSLCIAPDGRTLAVAYMGLPGHYIRFFSAPSLDERRSPENATRAAR